MMLILRRLVAYVCDALMLVVVVGLCLSIPISMRLYKFIDLNPELISNKTLLAEEMAKAFTQQVKLCVMAFTWITFFIYFSLSESSNRQATLGKRLFKLKVSNEQGNRISLLDACQRYFWFALPDILYYLLCGVTNDLGPDNQLSVRMLAIFIMRVLWYFPIFVTKEKRSAYDILSSTKVAIQ